MGSLSGRVLLDEGRRVIAADEVAYALAGIIEGGRKPGALEESLEALALLPGADEMAAVRRTVGLEAASCRHPGGGWTLVLSRGVLGEAQLPAAFLSTASHELLTPLTSLLGALQLLSRGVAGEPSRRDLLEAAVRGVERLLAVLSRIIDATALMTGRLEVRTEPFDLTALAGEELARARERFGRADLECAAMATDLPWARGDRRLISKVIAELLENAVKCSAEGSGIAVSVIARDGVIEVSVRDHGRGILPEHHEAVFRPFFQVDDSLTREVQGLGIGLAIARGIVVAHGGRIWIEGGSGEGSTFAFTIPAVDQA